MKLSFTQTSVNTFFLKSVVFEENCGVAAVGFQTKDFHRRNSLPSKKAKSVVFFCCIRQIKPRNKKIPVHYNTHEVKIMRRQYTTEEKQNLIVMFQKGRRKSLSLMTR